MSPDPKSPPPPTHPDAVIVEGVAHNGHPCRLVDNTASLDRAALRELLEALIQERRFGRRALSSGGSGVMRLDEPQFGHIQLGEGLYRLVLLPYEARIERF